MVALDTSAVWNCPPPLAADAATQMAYDNHLMMLCRRTPGPAYLRFYRMDPPAVTIGRHQRWARVIDEAVCTSHGWQWVRRPTGGGALLHRNEVNYAVVIGRGVLGYDGALRFQPVFDRILQALAAALRGLGLSVVAGAGRPPGGESIRTPQHGLCGRSLTGYEIAAPDGRKLLAAAQSVHPDGLLQHGTIYREAPGPADRFWPLHDNELDASAADQRWAGLGSPWHDDDWTKTASCLREGFLAAIGAASRSWYPDDTDLAAVQQQVHTWGQQGWHRQR